MNKCFTSMIIGVASSLAAGSANADHESVGIKIEQLSYAGTGCAAGSLRHSRGLSFDAFSLEFEDFEARVAPGLGFSERRKNCKIAARVSIPNGWSFAVAKVDYSGYVDLDYGIKALQKSTYNFRGSSQNAELVSTVYGPKTGSYRVSDVLGIESAAWSPCGSTATLMINAQVRLDSTRHSAAGLITLDRLRGSVKHVYGLKWRRC